MMVAVPFETPYCVNIKKLYPARSDLLALRKGYTLCFSTFIGIDTCLPTPILPTLDKKTFSDVSPTHKKYLGIYQVLSNYILKLACL